MTHILDRHLVSYRAVAPPSAGTHRAVGDRKWHLHQWLSVSEWRNLHPLLYKITSSQVPVLHWNMSHISASSIQIYSNPSKIEAVNTSCKANMLTTEPSASGRSSQWDPCPSPPRVRSLSRLGGDNIGWSIRYEKWHHGTFPSKFEWYWMPMHSWGVGEKEGGEVFAFEAKLRYHRPVSAIALCCPVASRKLTSSMSKLKSSWWRGGEEPPGRSKNPRSKKNAQQIWEHPIFSSHYIGLSEKIGCSQIWCFRTGAQTPIWFDIELLSLFISIHHFSFRSICM